MRMVEELKGRLTLKEIEGAVAVQAALTDLVAGRTPADVGLIARIA